MFDCYIEFSIKEQTREKRSETESMHYVVQYNTIQFIQWFTLTEELMLKI